MVKVDIDIKKWLSLNSVKKNAVNIVTLIAFIAFLVSNIGIDPYVASIIDTPYGNIFIIILSIMILSVTNPIVGLTGILVAYELIRRSSETVYNTITINEPDTEEQRAQKVVDMNRNQPNLGDTLEESIINQIPEIGIDTATDTDGILPVATDTYDAADF